MIVPCGVKICRSCGYKITEALDRFATVPDEEEKKLSQESDEPTPPKRTKKVSPGYIPGKLDANNYENDSPSSAHALLTGQQNSSSQQPSVVNQNDAMTGDFCTVFRVVYFSVSISVLVA